MADYCYSSNRSQTFSFVTAQVNDRHNTMEYSSIFLIKGSVLNFGDHKESDEDSAQIRISLPASGAAEQIAMP